MKLIECYVDNFGKLSAFSHTFSDGVNLIIGNNGCGKTTLSVFIKTMLFGFDTKKQKGEETDRKRYLPWQGGRYGGSLTFENGKKRYRIERTFGQRPSDDIFNLYDAESGTQSNDFTENLGEELFGIDADGFERTVFLSEKKFAVNGNNPKVAAKLSNLVGVDGDMGSYDSAVEMLEKREKYYRHRRGKGGLIGDICTEIGELDAKMIDLDRKKAEYAELESELKEITRKLDEAEAKKSSIEKKKIRLAYEEEYRSRANAIKELKERLDREKLFFSKRTPTLEEIRYEENKYNRAAFLRQTIEAQKAPKSDVTNADILKVQEHINAIDAAKIGKNANKSYQINLFIASFILLCSIACGALVHVALFAVALLSIPFICLFIKGSHSTGEVEKITDSAALFLKETTGEDLARELVYARLGELKITLSARMAEYQRIALLNEKNLRELNELTESYNAFLDSFPTQKPDRFAEIRERLSHREALTRQIEESERTLSLYATQRGIDPTLISAAAEEELDEVTVASEVKELSNTRYALESRLISLFESISMEDVLKEERLELADKLSKAEREHAVTLKAAEHLKAAKERLTAKYLGKMRKAFDKYLSSITAESESAFSLDTDFSLKKTENGLTNQISAYSLGTREIYSLITRLALVDALYEENEPFIILDDPFCHFDDKRCNGALAALGSISANKQIIYLTCSDSRAPK